MSVPGQNRRSRLRISISGLPSTADMPAVSAHFASGPLSDSCTAAKGILFDYFVGVCEQFGQHGEAKCLGRLEIDRDFKLDRLLHGHIGRLLTLENTIHIFSSAAKRF